MNVTSRRYGSAVVLQVSGRLDQDTCEAFRGDIMKQVEAASKSGGGIVLDLAPLEYVSSAGLRCFMLASRQAKQVSMKIFVAALQPMVAEIFQISHFNLIFQVFPTVREAVGAISAESATAYEKG
jgi:anti-anti-sigma factor